MAKTVVIYKSSHGNTEKILKELISLAGGDVAMKAADAAVASDIEEAEKVVLGGSIHAGKIQNEIGRFIDKHREILLKKQLALFIGCLEKNQAQAQLENVFPEDIKTHAEVKACIGGRVAMEKLPWYLKLIMKVIVKKDEDRTFYSAEGREQLAAFIKS